MVDFAKFEQDTRQGILALNASDEEAHALEQVGFVRRPAGIVLVSEHPIANLDKVADNWQRLGPSFVAQVARTAPVEWERGLDVYLERVAGIDVDWFLLGSTALLVRGADVPPNDIDLATDEVGAWKLGETFEDFMLWPVAATDWPIARFFGRMFLHTTIEWVGDVRPEVDEPSPRPWGPLGQSRLETVSWHGHDIRVPPLDLHLADERARGRAAHVEAIEALMANGAF
jgi:hypothetical protein